MDEGTTIGVYEEDDLLPLSAVQHLIFCERQCALIHVERLWRDNRLTVEGSAMHQRVHDTGPRREVRGTVIIARGVPLRSLRLGLVGRADVVEFHRVEVGAREGGHVTATALPRTDGLWTARPVEYKRGRPKRDRSDEIQLCAQAVCLEEMLEVHIEGGSLFYGAVQRRHDVQFIEELRSATQRAAARVHELVRAELTPRARREPKCRRCSLLAVCRPDGTGPQRSVRRYVAAAFSHVTKESG